MTSKVLQYAEKKIVLTKVLYVLLALFVPIAFYMAMTLANVTFDNAVIMLALLLSMLILFITYHEGKVAISALRRYRLEISDEHLLQIRDRHRELVLYGDIECVKVTKGFSGRVKRIHIVTHYRQLSISGYESLDLLLETLQRKKGIRIQL